MIARKLQIYWDNNTTVSIIINKGEHDLTKDNPMKLYSIIQVLDEIIEDELGVPVEVKYSKSLDELMPNVSPDCWRVKQN